MSFKQVQVSQSLTQTISAGTRDGHIYHTGVTTAANVEFDLSDFRADGRPVLGYEIYSTQDILVSPQDETMALGAGTVVTVVAGSPILASTWFRADEQELTDNKFYAIAISSTATVYIIPIYGRVKNKIQA